MTLYAFRLRPGQDLNQELKSFMKSERITAGIILSAVGSLSQSNIRLAGARKSLTITSELEILALHGTLSADGNHLHLTVADETGLAKGGHLMDGCLIRTTAEIVILALEAYEFSREADRQTGYDELVVRKKA